MLTCNKDETIVKHYQNQMDILFADDDFMPQIYRTPRIASAFNGWHYKDMMEMVPFCEENDPDPPNFVDLCVRENLIRDETDI